MSAFVFNVDLEHPVVSEFNVQIALCPKSRDNEFEMPNKPKQSKQSKQSKRRSNRRRRRNQQASRPSGMSAYARMLADPCNATLVPGLYGDSEGLLARLKSELTFSGNTDPGTSGYMLWLADSHGAAQVAAGSYRTGSLIGARFTNTSNTVTNTSTYPAFCGAITASDGSGFSRDDPALHLVNGIARDARTLSACIRLAYLGSMQSAAGQVAFLENLPLTNVLGSSVDELFRLATYVKRMGVGTHEVKFRPSENSKFFSTFELSNTTTGSQRDVSSPLTLGSPGSGVTTVEDIRGPRVFGFAWRGTDHATNLAFEFIKNVEWRPRTDSGLPTIKPVAIHETSMVHHAERELDRNLGSSWSLSSLMSPAGQIAETAFTGVLEQVGSTAKKYLAKQAMQMGVSMLPALAL